MTSEAQKRANKKSYEKNKNNSEWIEKKRERDRQYWATLKDRDPERYAEYLEKRKKRSKDMRDFYNKHYPVNEDK